LPFRSDAAFRTKGQIDRINNVKIPLASVLNGSYQEYLLFISRPLLIVLWLKSKLVYLEMIMIGFENTYLDLPERFYAKVTPEKVSKPMLLAFNRQLASADLGLKLETLGDRELADLFAGQVLPNSANPIALAYAGHQFGHFVPQLGDGRALLLGEVVTPQGRRFDIQLKGSGKTPFSRSGDGKSTIGPVIREYIVSEAMHALGVPTTRALAAVGTGDSVYREQPLPGGIFTRVASSHIRIGTFQYFASRGDFDGVKKLADYTIDRHYSQIKSKKNNYLHLLKCIATAQASLVADWMSFGFIHGVMNTDNMSVVGETIDYGPCAFIDNFSFNRVFSSIDRDGRYAYNNQISIAKWNLIRLAECLIPLIHDDQEQALKMTEDSLDSYIHIYEQKWLERMKKKLGLFSTNSEDEILINHWLQYLEAEDLDFTISFRKLSDTPEELKQTSQFKDFYSKWLQRLKDQPQANQEVKTLMRQVNPVFIPRNHHIERAIQAAIGGNLSIFKDMNELLKNPFIEQPHFEAYKVAPLVAERIQATFCGT